MGRTTAMKLGLCVLLGMAGPTAIPRSSPAEGPPSDPAGRGQGAEDVASALHELETSSDFRVRVAAALTVGRARPPTARDALERALGDAHPAVRAAAALALGTLGEGAAVPALERRLSSEPSASVQAQLRATIERLRAGEEPPAERTEGSLGPEVRYVVTLGAMHNRSGVRGDDLRRALLESARVRARGLRGAAVVERDSPLLRLALQRHLPVVALDGNVTQIQEVRSAGSLQVRACVEFTVRHDQNLRGTLSGTATTFGSGPTLSDLARARLEDDAVDGAVQSALRGAEQGLIVAAR